MEDKLITIDTLNMLSQKGFNYYHFPTQSIAQKWLRETKNLHISIIRNTCGYNYDICKADNGIHITDGLFKGSNDGGQWDTYEEALEVGIQETLKIIKS